MDAKGRVLVEAERGPQVKFAAPGADLAAARLGGGYALVRGTSFAAPIVAGLLAASLPSQDAEGARDALAALVRSAQHVGAAGIDRARPLGEAGDALHAPGDAPRAFFNAKLKHGHPIRAQVRDVSRLGAFCAIDWYDMNSAHPRLLVPA